MEVFDESLETKMDSVYRMSIMNLVSLSRDLRNCTHVEQLDDVVMPCSISYFENLLYVIEDAEERIREIQSDIGGLLAVLGIYSRLHVVQNLHRCKMDIAKAKRQASHILKKAIQENPDLSLANIEKMDVVRAAFLERDVKLAELQPAISELERKLQKAEEILKKYA